jgi:hypothetical protein
MLLVYISAPSFTSWILRFGLLIMATVLEIVVILAYLFPLLLYDCQVSFILFSGPVIFSSAFFCVFIY